MASHTGWAEMTGYSEAARQAYLPAAAAASSITNVASRAVFTINTFVTVRGLFLVDVATKGGATGTLYGIGDLTVSRVVVNGDILRATITLSD
jgi:alpha-D-ribose 1-methylphosphonate 5-triphosphate synthase subunit PhnG